MVKINHSIENFRFNVSIASFYEIYNHLNTYIKKDLSNNILREYIIKINKLIMPFIPHLASECLELYNCKDKDVWPKLERNITQEINLAIQINGKTKDVIQVKKDSTEELVNERVFKESKTRKHLEKKNIYKTIFVKNRIINYIINNK